MIPRRPTKSPWAEKADAAVAKFTREILGIANKAGVDYDYVGNKGGKAAEVVRTMDVNRDVVKELVTK